MAPPSSSTARRVASSRAGAQPARTDPARPPLKVVPARRRGTSPNRLVTYLPAIMVVAALLIVVAGQALLANGQVRMAGLDQQLQVAQAQHSQRELSVSRLETPSRIVGDATGSLGLTHPTQVIQIPSVPLNTPLPTPTVTPAGAGTSTTTPTVGQ